MTTNVSNKGLIARLIILFLILIMMLICVNEDASGKALAYENQCDDIKGYPRLPNEYIITSNGVRFDVCTGFSNIRDETDMDTLVLKIGSKTQWNQFFGTMYLTLENPIESTRYNLAMTREFSTYQALQIYDEPGIMLYYTVSTGHYVYLWYVEDAKRPCDVTQYSININKGMYMLCGGVLDSASYLTNTMYDITVLSDFVFGEIDTRSDIFMMGENTRVFMFNNAWTNLTEQDIQRYKYNPGIQFYWERSAGRYDVLHYEYSGVPFRVFMPLVRNHK